MASKFKTKSATVEVLNFSGGNQEEVESFVGKPRDEKAAQEGAFLIALDDYDLWATAGDWVIKTAEGRFHACDPRLFEALFTPL